MELNKMWLFVLVLLVLLIGAGHLIIDEERLGELEKSENHRLLKNDTRLYELFVEADGEAFVVSEHMTMAYVNEFRDYFLMTMTKFKSFRPVNRYFNSDRCGWDGQRKPRLLSELVQCKPKTLILVRHSNVALLKQENRDLEFITVDSSAHNILLQARLIDQ